MIDRRNIYDMTMQIWGVRPHMHSESYWYLMDHHYTLSFVYLFLFPPPRIYPITGRKLLFFFFFGTSFCLWLQELMFAYGKLNLAHT